MTTLDTSKPPTWWKKTMSCEAFHEMNAGKDAEKNLSQNIFKELMECKAYHDMKQADWESGRHVTMIIVRNLAKIAAIFMGCMCISIPGYMLTIFSLNLIALGVMTFNPFALLMGVVMFSPSLVLYLGPCFLFGFISVNIIEETFNEISEYRRQLVEEFFPGRVS